MRYSKKIYVKAYQALNLGDDLFVKILLERYPRHQFLIYGDKKKHKFLKDCSNVTISHAFIWRIYNFLTSRLNLRVVNSQCILASLCKATVEIGGSMYREPYIPYLKNDLFRIKPFFVIGVNFETSTSDAYKKAVRSYLSVKTDVCFRDSVSYDLLSLENARYASDVIFNMEFPEKTGNGIFISVISFGKEHSELSVYQEDYERIIIDLIRDALSRDEQVTLAAFCTYEGDDKEIENIMDMLSSSEREKIRTCIYDGDIEYMLECMLESKVIVGTRFHSIVLGLAMQKRVIPISYNEKTDNMLADIGLSRYNNLLSKLFNVELKECMILKEEIQKIREKANRQFEALDEYLGDNSE